MSDDQFRPASLKTLQATQSNLYMLFYEQLDENDRPASASTGKPMANGLPRPIDPYSTMASPGQHSTSWHEQQKKPKKAQKKPRVKPLQGLAVTVSSKPAEDAQGSFPICRIFFCLF